MKIIDGIRNYVIEQEFEIRIINNKVDVINYKDIGHFDSNKVIINYIELFKKKIYNKKTNYFILFNIIKKNHIQ